MKRTIPILMFAAVLSACSSGSSVGSSKDTENTGEPSADNSSQRWVPTPGALWVWHLQDYDNLDVDENTEVYDIDLFEGAESLVKQLKARGKKVICYFSAGTREDWRPDADKFTEASVIAEGGLENWPDETWLNIGDSEALSGTIKPILEARLDLARDSGCDAVEPDNVDGYANVEETRGMISAADQLAFNLWLAEAAHNRNLSIGLKNDLDQLDELVDHYDFAVNEQCFAYGNECVLYEDTFLAAGKAVFNQEYYEDGAEGEIGQAQFLNNACAYFLSAGISALWKQGYDLDGRNVMTCPE
ncbi:endo alpha-1,4 polygalactosaminidase [Hahella ganghwensis]|uniref:endo alpha-1,4 polygalactosaminidase n=1 Tax=Hahella ganghwensis TaxID=286420 RepID=UPI0004761C84|nr:endo alpha-1,4 polygalactosaminidase [Hahella ganghwensis]